MLLSKSFVQSQLLSKPSVLNHVEIAFLNEK